MAANVREALKGVSEAMPKNADGMLS